MAKFVIVPNSDVALPTRRIEFMKLYPLVEKNTFEITIILDNGKSNDYPLAPNTSEDIAKKIYRAFVNNCND